MPASEKQIAANRANDGTLPPRIHVAWTIPRSSGVVLGSQKYQFER